MRKDNANRSLTGFISKHNVTVPPHHTDDKTGKHPLTFAEPNPLNLSKRETEIIQLVMAGHNTPQIADLLNISKATVKKHREHLMSKLGAHSVAQMIAIAHNQGIIPASVMP